MARSVYGVAAVLFALSMVPIYVRGQAPAEIYDLREGSTITDECVFCDRAPIVRPLTGSFVLTQLPSLVCCIYSVTELAFQDASRDYVVKGEGMYSTNSIGEVTQQMSLDVSVSGAEGVHLESGAVKILATFPLIDITVTEDGTRDPGHKYTIHFAAAPHAPKVLYELVEGKEGSNLQLNCPVCRIANPIVPIAGTFRLARINSEADPNGLYTVDFLDFHSTLAQVDYRIAGLGIYEQGGEVALTQHMNLSVGINDAANIILDSGVGPVPDGVAFPEIQIDLVQENPTEPISYSIHLVARPAKPATPAFKRGDSNGDDRVDISDGVHILNWRFSGGAEPGCLDAVDTNADSIHDLTDAVFLLLYLFQGGRTPPFPGPDVCGSLDTPVFGCASYPPCSV